MRIKKHPNKNDYLLIEQGLWVRNFTKPRVPPIDINELIGEKDYQLMLNNEFMNSKDRIPWIDSENIVHQKAIIVSDGYQFEEKHKILKDLSKDVIIIGVNGSLVKWQATRSINYYVANNPYKECLKFLPRRGNLPKCIISTRTNYEFLQNYRGAKYRYAPVSEEKYGGLKQKETDWFIDDYRNPICAAIILCYYFGVEKLVLFCCDDSFGKERPSSIKLENELWMYPQQLISHNLIEANLYWLKNNPVFEIDAFDCSSGPNYKNVAYIKESEILDFLGKNEER
jgi:hypothetical protein